jgi:hypothetical protein
MHEITHSRVSVRWCHSFKPVLTSHSHIGLSTESFMFPDQEDGSRPFHSCEEEQVYQAGGLGTLAMARS